jgi:AraC family transcriptional regulator
MTKTMQARIENLKEKKLMGYRQKMSLANNKTAVLWGQFAPRIKEVKNRSSAEVISLQIYGPSYYLNFNPNNEFEKWAAVEVKDYDTIPDGMEVFSLEGGLYAVFDYKGLSSDSGIFQYIFGTWLPNSAYEVDNRPHFEVLGSKYKNNDPNSEEEIWIPIKTK